ncbi:MAG: bifunctional phosphoribosylaminoimidazolecarboxamide formyltransferase/IMP cyclohydrolase [Bifidobacteriaceae bacterium]|jgi:phosphoribosylaminoimidazolecarboxamide formyltransferase/IMP cyclohydrolase|nr:bifunctional phosphoribosylaminoimidazolecarboxamide formyltransferase/IMP cyclohydrolase [Bifidobacteriaceae bacterium]
MPSSQSSAAKAAQQKPVRRALISVYDKTGLPELAQALNAAGVAIVSTGSTAKVIESAGVPVTPVDQVTGFPECLDGRVKTLHPKIHAGLLADLRKPEHAQQLKDLGVEPFELVVCNLYPFAQTVASGASVDECVEQIDIGGPSMVRAAAKNHPSVAVVVSPARYGWVAQRVAQGGFTLEERKELARDAFIHTADYDVAVATWMTSTLAPEQVTDPATGQPCAAPVPLWRGGTWRRISGLRYGENPHQGAGVYAEVSGGFGLPGLATARQLHGKAMSYNNYQDADAARRACMDFKEPCVAVCKHANPCGIAVGKDIAEAHRKAHACDSVSAYGGVIAANRPVTLEMAKQIKPIFTEVVVAPGYEPEALELLITKKNLRILELDVCPLDPVELRPISGGAIMQQRDLIDAPGDVPATWKLVSGEAADAATLRDLEFAWRACRSVKSNAILLAKDGASVGVGMGQVNRVDSAMLAVQRAGEDRAKGSVAASDAFFPFADGFEILAKGGVKAVVQPGGSIRDGEVIEAAQKAGITMYLTGTRHFFH